MRFGACSGVAIHIIHPAGFALTDPGLKRAGLDYLDRAALVEHSDWSAFMSWRSGNSHRLIVLSTRASDRYFDFSFRPGDVLLLGRESAGLPETIHNEADARLAIPQTEGTRSLNVALAGAIVASEALRQTGGFPD